MTQKILTPKERQALKQQAHHLNAVVMIGQNGLTDAIIHEVDSSLTAHELIKIKVMGDDRAEREAIFQNLCDTLNAHPVQHIGKQLVLWRPNES
ncbi:ribosome assembly RNA-binding protein YhbY [Neisseria sp. Ec49-e6-T10]|uniref:ribosome assembly RNA-binding protein YhbY n=1 Tax=Neisseria sp. Ec49-e6-T10 TaxID=3140744 RepID=UPI003EBB4F98